MKLDAVFAGDGAAADYAGRDVQGKVVVVRHNDTVAVERAGGRGRGGRREAAAGRQRRVGRLQPWDETPWCPPSPPPLTVATLTQDEGEELISQIAARQGPADRGLHPTTDYLYDLVHHWTARSRRPDLPAEAA